MGVAAIEVHAPGVGLAVTVLVDGQGLGGRDEIVPGPVRIGDIHARGLEHVDVVVQDRGNPILRKCDPRAVDHTDRGGAVVVIRQLIICHQAGQVGKIAAAAPIPSRSPRTS